MITKGLWKKALFSYLETSTVKVLQFCSVYSDFSWLLIGGMGRGARHFQGFVYIAQLFCHAKRIHIPFIPHEQELISLQTHTDRNLRMRRPCKAKV